MRVSLLRHLTPARSLFLTLAILVGAAFIDPGAALNFLAAFQPYAAQRDIAYGAGERRRLDVYLPTARQDPAPVIVFIYGGTWSSGAKETYRFVGASLAARGAVVVIPDYRLYPQARFPTFLEDVAAAVRWARDHVGQLNGDSSKIFIMGHSAGAHIAMMLTFDKRWLEKEGISPARDVAGAIGLSGPYHFAIDSDLLRGVFGGEANAAATQPLLYVARDAPPVLLATGAQDVTVRPQNTRDLAARVRAVGGDAQTIFYRGLAHRDVIAAFSPALRFLAPVADDVSRFVAQASTRASRADKDRDARRAPERRDEGPP